MAKDLVQKEDKSFFPKKSWKARIIEAIIMGLLNSLLIIWLQGDFSKKSLIGGAIFAVLIGVTHIFVFPPLMRKTFQMTLTRITKKLKSLSKNIKANLQDGEPLHFENGATLFRGMEGVGGRLFLTDRRVLFQSIRDKIENGQARSYLESSIYLENIREIKTKKMMKADIGIVVITHDDLTFYLAVAHRDDFLLKLEEVKEVRSYNYAVKND